MLAQARDLGFLGPGPVERHLEHAEGFAQAIRSVFGGPGFTAAADLGSGGGLPGLPLTLHFPGATFLLVEAGARRAAFLVDVVERLGLGDRVSVAHERAESVGRLEAHRGRFDLVVSRGFGLPAVVAECAAPLLAPGGAAVVSEPPGGRPDRWSPEGLGLLRMEPGPGLSLAAGAFQVLRQIGPCPDRFPRRVGVPAKRPLFGGSSAG